MAEKVKALCIKYREILIYLIVGVMTTIVSWGAAYLGKLVLNTDISWQNTANNNLIWLLGLMYA